MNVVTKALIGSLIAAVSLLEPVAAKADAVADYYHGKTINLLIGTGIGGGYDTYGRVLARFLGKHVPGNPTVVAQNVIGGGGLKMLGDIYNTLPKDGTYIGTGTAVAMLAPLFGDKNAAFDTTKFTWLGNMNKDVSACGAWKGSGVTKFSDSFQREATFGSTASNSYLYQIAALIKELLGAKIRIINGYSGSRDVNLAMRRGEIDAVCGLFLSSVRSDFGEDVADGNLRFIIQLGQQNEPYFGNAVNIHDYLHTDQDRELAAIILGQSEITRPYLAAPGLRPDLADALRKAFMDTVADPALLSFAQHAEMAINPETGDQVGKEFAAFFHFPPSIIAKATKLMGQ